MGTSQLTGPVITTAQGIIETSTTQNHVIGAYVETSDGRGFRYAKIGAVASVPGKVYQSPAEDTTNYNPSGGLAVAAQAIGDTSVTLTGSLTITANALAGGYLSVAVTPGQGYTYRIKGNTAVAAAANCVVTLDDPIQVALTTSSKVVAAVHPYNGVVVIPTTNTGAAVGVAPVICAAASYGWLQTYGMCAVLNAGGVTVGLGVSVGTTIGAVKVMAATLNQIGYAVNTNVTTEYDFVYLTIR